jgi:hypothetical protein
MFQQVAMYGIWAFTAWLTLIGLIMAFAPARALAMLRLAGSSVLINVGELGMRLVFGLALVGTHPVSKFPHFFLYFGAFMAASSVLILLIPRRWHSAYAVWWANRLPAWFLRVMAPVTFAAAGALLYAVWPAGLQS